MNRLYRLIRTTTTDATVATGSIAEQSRRGGMRSTCTQGSASDEASFALNVLAISVMLAVGTAAYAAPAGGIVTAGGANIASSPGTTTITQTTQNTAISWQSFNIGSTESVRFNQPSSSAVALNRVIGSDPSSIFGSLSANGKVFLINPNGVLFGKGAQVNVGGLVASTLAISDADLMAGKYQFAGTSKASVSNQGTITADGGYVALLGANVNNQGVISARLGSVALASGNAMTLDVAGDGLLNVTVNQGAVESLVENGGLIRADGGRVLMTAMAAGGLLQGSVNNTGIVQAQTLSTHRGEIRLLGDMHTGVTTVGGTLDASAPQGGDGGFIETSAAKITIANTAKITTVAPFGATGQWLIDPQDFLISAIGGDISGATLSALLVTNDVTISTLTTGPSVTNGGTTPPSTSFFANKAGNGDITVNDAITKADSPAVTTLTLLASGNVNINQAMVATHGNFKVCCGNDINVNAPITTTNGSVLLSAGHDVNVKAAMSTTTGNITMCAANDINILGKLTLVDGTSIPAQSLGLPYGLVLNAGNGGTGKGTVSFGLTPASVTGGTPSDTPVAIYYNPVSYQAPTDYSTNFILVKAPLKQYMLVNPRGPDKVFDGSVAAPTLTFLNGISPTSTEVFLVSSAASYANFDDAAIGTNKPLTFGGYTLGGTNAGKYALPFSCCNISGGRATGTISAALAALSPPTGSSPASTPASTPATGAPIATLPTSPIVPAGQVVQSAALAPLLTPLPSMPTVPIITNAALPPELQTLQPPAPDIAPPDVVPETPPVVPPVYVPPRRPHKQARY